MTANDKVTQHVEACLRIVAATQEQFEADVAASTTRKLRRISELRTAVALLTACLNYTVILPASYCTGCSRFACCVQHTRNHARMLDIYAVIYAQLQAALAKKKRKPLVRVKQEKEMQKTSREVICID